MLGRDVGCRGEKRRRDAGATVGGSHWADMGRILRQAQGQSGAAPVYCYLMKPRECWCCGGVKPPLHVLRARIVGRATQSGLDVGRVRVEEIGVSGGCGDCKSGSAKRELIDRMLPFAWLAER